ncbi:MAG: hypothetical protein ACLFR5_03515, partial [Halobacteriales archaeon]
MRRREFVAAVAVVGSGCLSGPDETDGNSTDGNTTDGTDSTTDGNTSTNGENADEGMSREEAVEGINRSFVRLESGLAFSAFPPGTSSEQLHMYHGFLERESNDSPPKLRVVVENDEDETVTVDADEVVPYGRTPSATYDGSTLYLAPVESHERVDEVPEVERRNGLWRVEEGKDWRPSEFTVDDGGIYVGEYAPVVERDDELHEGVYLFGESRSELTVFVWNIESPGPEGGSQFAGEGFSDLPGHDETRWYHEADESTPPRRRERMYSRVV